MRFVLLFLRPIFALMLRLRESIVLRDECDNALISLMRFRCLTRFSVVIPTEVRKVWWRQQMRRGVLSCSQGGLL
jgi:hypothetical protein